MPTNRPCGLRPILDRFFGDDAPSRISGQMSVSCCGHLRRPALDECSKAVERLGEIVSGRGKAQAEMRGRFEAIARSEQGSTLGGGLAERSGVLSAHQPGEGGHAALRRNPAEYVAMLRHETLEELEVSGGDLLSLAEHGVAFANCDLRKNLSGSGVRDGEVGARGPVLLAALGIVLDHPSRAHTGNRKCLRQVSDHGGMRQARRRFRLPSVVDGMVDLVAHQLNSALGGEFVQGFHLAVADGRARRIVGAVDQDEFGLRVGEPLDLVGVDAEAVLAAHAIKAGFQAKGLRECREGSESRQREDDVHARLGGEPHEREKRLGRAGHDLDGLYGNALHFSNRFTQTVCAGRVAVDQLVVQEAVARFVVGERKDVVYGPGRSGARSEVEFYVVFVLVDPGIEQEWLELHASTPEEKLAPVIDSANWRTDGFSFMSDENPTPEQSAANPHRAATLKPLT